jgi:pimeloyl-ACP methyl ester carboxylesterase
MPHPVAHHIELAGRRIAYRKRAGDLPTLLFLPGYASDMDGNKAVAIDAFAERMGLAMVRFDYSGTGLSDGAFDDGTLDLWLDQALGILDQLTEGPVVLIGSSMGGWLALHLALRRPERVQALIGIAAAPDFTEWGFSADARAMLRADGEQRISEEDFRPTRAFWESGQRMRILEAEIAVDCPVRLIHGDQDKDVPATVALRLLARLRSDDVQLKLIKGGGHRLSERHEIEAILRSIAELLETRR